MGDAAPIHTGANGVVIKTEPLDSTEFDGESTAADVQVKKENGEDVSDEPVAKKDMTLPDLDEKDVESGLTLEIIRQEQLDDPVIGIVLKAKESDDVPPECDETNGALKGYISNWSLLSVENGILKRHFESQDGKSYYRQICVPETRVEYVLTKMHPLAAEQHIGIRETIDAVTKRYFWYKWKVVVYRCTRKCGICREAKKAAVKKAHTAAVAAKRSKAQAELEAAEKRESKMQKRMEKIKQQLKNRRKQQNRLMRGYGGGYGNQNRFGGGGGLGYGNQNYGGMNYGGGGGGGYQNYGGRYNDFGGGMNHNYGGMNQNFGYGNNSFGGGGGGYPPFSYGNNRMNSRGGGRNMRNAKGGYGGSGGGRGGTGGGGESGGRGSFSVKAHFSTNELVWVHVQKWYRDTGSDTSNKSQSVEYNGPYKIVNRVSDFMYQIQKVPGKKVRVVNYNKLYNRESLQKALEKQDEERAKQKEGGGSDAQESKPTVTAEG